MKFSSFAQSTKKVFKKMKNKKFFPLFLTIAILLFAGGVYAVNGFNPDCDGTFNPYPHDCYQAPGSLRGSATTTVAEWNDTVCLKNLAQKDLFIPTDTASQWHSFSSVRNDPYLNLQNPLCLVNPPVPTDLPPCYLFLFAGAAGGVYGGGGPTGNGGPEDGNIALVAGQVNGQIDASNDLTPAEKTQARAALTAALFSSPSNPPPTSSYNSGTTADGWFWSMDRNYEASNPPNARYGYAINVSKTICRG